MAVPTDRASFKEYCARNKYSAWYFAFVEKATARGWTKSSAPCYVEGHHVIPRSITGDSIRTGELVYLTAREHFVMHLLLPKMLSGKDKQKMQLALHRITTGNNRNYCKSSHLYELIKKHHAIAASERSIEYWASLTTEQKSSMRTGEKNSRWGAVVTGDTRQKISIANKGKLSKEKHPLWGIGHSKAARNKCSVNAARKALGKKWFNDGVNAFLAFPQDAHPTWNLGRK
jgi:hypothetical protein